MMICVVVLPSYFGSITLIIGVPNSCRGDSQERRYLIITLVLPSDCFFLLFYFYYLLVHVGEITQGSNFYSTLVLPSLNRKTRIMAYRLLNSCRGDSQERRMKS